MRALILKLENVKFCGRWYPLKSYNLNNSLNVIKNLNGIEKVWYIVFIIMVIF